MKIDQEEVEKEHRGQNRQQTVEDPEEWSFEIQKLNAKAGQKTGISKDSAHRILREDLGLKPFKFKKRQKLFLLWLQ